jgi:hypothetical protein
MNTSSHLTQVHDWNQLPLILTNEHIASLLVKSKRTVQDDAARAPWRLPPRLQIPGTAGVRYAREEVRTWLENLGEGKLPPRPADLPIGRRRGRPPGSTTKALRARRDAQRAATSGSMR